MEKRLMVAVLVMAALMMAACGSTLSTAAASEAACPQPRPETALYRNDDLGYCLLYPASYALEEFDSGQVMITSAPREVEPPQPFVSVNVAPADRRTPEAVANELAAEFEGMGLTFESTPITVGGAEGIVVDGLPGQDITRRVLVVSGEYLVDMMFVPASEEYGETYTQMEALYETVIGSFTFLSAQ